MSQKDIPAVSDHDSEEYRDVLFEECLRAARGRRSALPMWYALGLLGDRYLDRAPPETLQRILVHIEMSENDRLH